MIGAVSAASDVNVTALGSDLADNTITQHLDAVEDNATEKSISDDNKQESENALKMGADTPDNVLKDSGTTTVNNWGELESAINDGAVIELSGDDVYYAEGSGISIDSGTVTIDGKGHTIDAQRLNSHIFEINNGATLKLENLILKNALNNLDVDGGAIYNDQGTLTVINCTFTNNTATTEMGGAIYNYEGTLKIVNSRFEKNSKYDRAIYNYGTEDDSFRLTIINTTMVEDKVAVNLDDNERRLDDKRDIDLLTTEVNAYIQETIYNGTPVFISVSGIDEDFTGSITVNITNTIYNTNVDVAKGKGNTTMNLDINRYTARFKNFISVDEKAFDREDTKPYLEINFRIICDGSLSALEDLISKSTDNVTLNQDYIFNTACDAPGGIKISSKELTINGNGHSVKASNMDDGAIFYIENEADVRMVNITLEGGHAVSASHLKEQTRMGGAIYVANSNLTIINCTFKDNEAKDGFGGAIYGHYSNLDIIRSNFINNDAANGKILCIWGGNANILNSNVNQEDVHSEFDQDNEILGPIAIFNDLNATLYIPNYVKGNETLFNITQPENLNAAASLTINNDPKGNIQITNGHASANLNLDFGSYVATITTPDIVYYTDSSRNLTCTCLSATTTSNEFKVLRKVDVELTVKNIAYGENETITANIDAEGNVTIILDGRTIEDGLVIDNNEIRYAIPKHYLNAGKHTIEVRYNGDTYVCNCSKSAEFTVNKINSSLTVSDVVLDYGMSIIVSVSAEGASGISAKIDNNNVKVNGFNVPVSGLKAGVHSLTVTTKPDENHTAVTKTVTITVNMIASTLSASPVATVYNGGEYIVATLKDNAGKAISGVKVEIRLNGIIYNKNTDKNGKVKLSTDGLAPKTYSATISFAGNANYVKSTKTVSVKVTKATPKLTASKKTFKKSVKIKKYKVALKTNQNKVIKSKWVTLKVNKKTYKVKTNSKGQATFKITNLKKKGTSNAVVKYAGDKYYNSKTVNTKITVK
ncbi:Ig-like domain repeat protein [Methanobrevibacter sp.]|uniref:Ig-like domain repeat protein n=1 Tax=Methanobrevibacter sp. TaxID=66852 RepID=UPI0025F00B63|nr:Ig-like domain repeat protein [Methanobrevibacter sp.]MBR4448042.1 Ig-like domain repeat protein [Methanobrevibacter sp.]